MAETVDNRVPLLERLRMLFIISANLDELFEIRIANLKRQLSRGLVGLDTPMLPDKHLAELSRLTHPLVDRLYQILNEILLPELAEQKVFFLSPSHWTQEQAAWLKSFFRSEVSPLVSPIALDLAHPFPKLVNKSLNFIVSLQGKDALGVTAVWLLSMPRVHSRALFNYLTILRRQEIILFI